MKMKRLIAVLMLAMLVALCAVLTACGSDPIEVGANPGAHEHEAVSDTETPDDSENEGESVCLHKETEIKDKKAATCLAQGYTGDTVCSDCGKVLEEGTVTPTGACNFKDLEDGVLLAPTCTSKGVVKQECTVCNATRNKSIDAKGHQFNKALDECDELYPDAEGTLLESKTFTKQCENCSYTEEVEHDFPKSRTRFAATCTEAAYTCYVCRDCKQIYDKQYVDDSEPLGHAFGEWEVTTEPTCQTEGEETRTCTRDGCNETETQPVEVDPEAHEWSEGVTNGDMIDYECLNEGCEATKQEPVVAPDPEE
ncbi:MAG: hypothetical protein IJY22_06550 [Clostridia bacterium]|nr:hypothetical protein [Clostridia bacterium]